jgi:hypothetical protein
MRQHWEDEWQALVRERDAALARSQRIQDEITDSIRRRQPPPMRLMRAADAAEAELAAIRARIRDFLHHLRAA